MLKQYTLKSGKTVVEIPTLQQFFDVDMVSTRLPVNRFKELEKALVGKYVRVVNICVRSRKVRLGKTVEHDFDYDHAIKSFYLNNKANRYSKVITLSCQLEKIIEVKQRAYGCVAMTDGGVLIQLTWKR
jgi:hypothetical protein